MIMHVFHSYGPWRQYKITLPMRRLFRNWALAEAVEVRQETRCLVCGKVKDEHIRTDLVRTKNDN